MEAPDCTITNGDPNSELIIIESKTLLVEQEEVLSSELTSSDCDTPPSELNNTLTSLTPDPDLSNTDCDYRAGVKDSEDPSCSSCLESSNCFTDESIDEASPQKRSKNLPGFSSQHWHMSRCFDRYWKHYYQSMAWCQRHFYIMRSMSNFMNFTGHFQSMNSSRCTTPSVGRGQQFRFSPSQGRGRGRSRGGVRRGACQQNPGAGRQKGHSQASRVVDPDSHGGADSDDSEVYEMELTEEMVQFFAHSEEHRKQRDASKEIIGEDGRVQKRIQIEEAKANKKAPTVEAPSERPGVRRTAEMTKLYGKGAAMIHGMETAVQMSYDRTMDIRQPKFWPNMPLKIMFS